MNLNKLTVSGILNYKLLELGLTVTAQHHCVQLVGFNNIVTENSLSFLFPEGRRSTSDFAVWQRLFSYCKCNTVNDHIVGLRSFTWGIFYSLKIPGRAYILTCINIKYLCELNLMTHYLQSLAEIL